MADTAEQQPEEIILDGASLNDLQSPLPEHRLRALEILYRNACKLYGETAPVTVLEHRRLEAARLELAQSTSDSGTSSIAASRHDNTESESRTQTTRRGPGRPRKVVPPRADPTPEVSVYRDSEWFLHTAPDDDDAQVERLFIEERKIFDACTEPEWLGYLDCHVRQLMWIYHREFAVDGLLEFSRAARPPFSHEGVLTPGGRFKAQLLFCHERILAGTVTPEDRKPDLSKLRGYIGPLLWELMVERA